jgi:hypothetical protein
LPRSDSAGFEFGCPNGEGDGGPQWFGGGFDTAGIQPSHVDQLAVFEGVVRAGGLIEELAGTVLELPDDLHGLPVDVIGEHEMAVRGG